MGVKTLQMKMLTVMMVMLKIDASQRSFFLCDQNLCPQHKKVRLLVNDLLASMKQKRITDCALVVSSKDSLKNEEGDTESIEMRCFKPKVGSSTVT